MGFLRPDEPLEERFSRVLFTRDSRSRQAVTKGQSGIRGALLPGEQVLGIALDERSRDETVVLTGRRVLIMRRGGRNLVRAIDVADLPGRTPRNRGMAGRSSWTGRACGSTSTTWLPPMR